MPMNPRLLRPLATRGLDADARTYIAAVEAADGETLEQGVKTAINDFIVGCKSDGIWDAIKASCILAGARTLAGALVPLKGAAPTNNGPFVSGDYNRETGLVGNGTSKYLDTNYSFTQSLQDNRHVAVWVTTPQTSGSHAYLGSSSDALTDRPRTQLVAANGSEGFLISRCADESSNTSATANNVAGLQGLSRAASASYTRRANATNQTVSVASLSGDDAEMWIYARNTTGGSAQLYSTARLAFYSIGEAIDLADLDTRLSALVTAIGAAI